MKKRNRNCIGAVMTVMATTCLVGTVQGEMPDVYELEPIMVTATRSQKKDLDIPATTEVITQEQIKNMGAAGADQALRYATGVIFKGTESPRGGEFLIRGKRRGTLVMVDGVSINFRNGYAKLQNILAEDIEKIEIIRGGGAVMYGSDAIGGVINVITKKKKTSSVSVGVGNLGRQQHSLQWGTDRFGVGFQYEKMGNIWNASAPSLTKNPLDSKFFHFRGSHRSLLTLTGQPTDHVTMRLSFGDFDSDRSYMFANKTDIVPYDDRASDTKELQGAIQYEKDGLSVDVAYHMYKLHTEYEYYEYKDKASAELIGILDRRYHYKKKDTLFSLVVNKEWTVGEDVLVVGGGIDHNTYWFSQVNKPKWDKKTGRFKAYLPSAESSYARNVYSLYASYDHKFNEKNSMTVAGRYTRTGNSPGDKEFSQWTPQVQYLYKARENLSLFASYGESFALPTMDHLYGKGLNAGNPDLKPETGKHWEVGAKWDRKKALWKLSFFDSDVKNFMRLKENPVTGEHYAVNEDTKNMGVELSVDVKHNDVISSNWGVVLQNPKFYDARYPKKGWQRDYGRVQFNGGITYHKDRWTASIHASYLGQRVLSKYQEAVRPMLLTSLHVGYQPNDRQEFFLNIDNLLDRSDLVGQVSSRYYSTPFNFVAGMKARF